MEENGVAGNIIRTVSHLCGHDKKIVFKTKKKRIGDECKADDEYYLGYARITEEGED